MNCDKCGIKLHPIMEKHLKNGKYICLECRNAN